MMDGPSHYREAEELTAEAHEAFKGGHFGKHIAFTREAQVHATLALAAATAWCVWVDRPHEGDYGGFELSEEDPS
jgi:hypothetical protein